MRAPISVLKWMGSRSGSHLLNVLLGAACALLLIIGSAWAQNGEIMQEHATGTFDVKIAPETVAGKATDPDLGQMSIDKILHGDLEGTSLGSMLTAGSPARGSAAYVAIEKVTGTLKGRKGSFVLMHSATMAQGKGEMNVTVAPESGTGDLTGLTGKLAIRVEGGKHHYDFDYTLPGE
ncbi:MAG TPA: DUF3224 domain-containing protein [Rhizomicrobium sp.]